MYRVRLCHLQVGEEFYALGQKFVVTHNIADDTLVYCETHDKQIPVAFRAVELVDFEGKELPNNIDM